MAIVFVVMFGIMVTYGIVAAVQAEQEAARAEAQQREAAAREAAERVVAERAAVGAMGIHS